MSQPLLVKNDDGIITLTLNLPELRNPISGEDMQNALIEAMSAADRDLSIRAVILTGAGSAFSSGGNVNDMQMGRGIVDSNPAATRSTRIFSIERTPEFLGVPAKCWPFRRGYAGCVNLAPCFLSLIVGAGAPLLLAQPSIAPNPDGLRPDRGMPFRFLITVSLPSGSIHPFSRPTSW